MSRYQAVIGRFEHVDVMEELNNVPAKIDTGAFRSAIHASNIRVLHRNGHDILFFKLLGHPAYQEAKDMSTKFFKVRDIRSSNGEITTRYEIMLKIRLGLKIFRTSFTLIDRSNNVFPILVGRHALNGRFLIDSQKSGLSRKEIILAIANTPESKDESEEVR